MPYSTLDYVCPVCGARPGEPCNLTTGEPRFTPHMERKWIADDHRKGLVPGEDPPDSELSLDDAARRPAKETERSSCATSRSGTDMTERSEHTVQARPLLLI